MPSLIQLNFPVLVFVVNVVVLKEMCHLRTNLQNKIVSKSKAKVDNDMGAFINYVDMAGGGVFAKYP